jgi:DNA helicase-2/ATP-dependent DNA helicase PcrA
MEERIETLQRDILAIRDMRPFAAMNYIRKAVGYDEFLAEYARDRKIEKEGLAEIIDALQESSRTHASFKEWFDHIEQYQQELEASLKQERTEKEAVTLATFHSAKGLEFDTVHIIDVNEGITPYKKAVLPADMEEERRMFYVGITRARKKLYLYVLKKIHHHDVEASRFLTEMRRQSSSNSASSNNSSNFSSTASNSSSSKIFSRDGLPSSSSK